MKISLVFLELTKSIFHLSAGKQVKMKVLKRPQALSFFSPLEPCTAAMEACGTASKYAPCTH